MRALLGGIGTVRSVEDKLTAVSFSHLSGANGDTMNSINWVFFPKSAPAPDVARDVVTAFDAMSTKIDSESHDLGSDRVLALVAPELQSRGFVVETSKKASGKIRVPVLFGRGGRVEKSFDADAWDRDRRMVLEVEAGRGVLNNQFLKDFFQACMMFEVDYFGIAVRNTYKGNKDFETVEKFFETMYASNRLGLPLLGTLILGY
jgi:hypothetical protein